MSNKCINCDIEIPRGVDYCPDCEARELSKIRGFLILPAIGIILSIISLSWSTFQTLKILVDKFQLLTPTLTWLVSYELVGFFLLFLLSVYTCFLFFGKKKALPKTYILLMLSGLAFHAVDVYLTHHFLATPVASDDLRVVFNYLVSSCIWVPYFIVSVRVKRTFVK